MLPILLISTLAFVTLAGLGLAFTGGESAGTKAVKRVNGGVNVRESRRVAKNQPSAQDVRRKQIIQSLREQDRKMKKVSLSLPSRLQQAGLSMKPRTFYILSGVLGLVIFIIPVALRQHILIGLGAGFAAGFGLPRWVVGFLAKKRSEKFTSAFAEAIDVIVRGIKSGLPVHDCLKVISQESPDPVKGEFVRLVENMAVGMTLDQGLEKMYERMPINEVRFMGIVIAIQQKTGGNLAETLSNLSAVLRARKLMKEKIKALSSEAVASAFIIGSLPPGVGILITVIRPDYMQPLFTTTVGHFMLLTAVFLMSFGIFVMRKMINFKF